MQLRNAIFYKINISFFLDVAAIEEYIQTKPFLPFEKNKIESIGWGNPRGIALLSPGNLPIEPLKCDIPVATTLTAWLRDDAVPDGIEIGDAAILTDEEGGTVTFKKQWLWLQAMKPMFSISENQVELF